jgi:predicted DNA-binding transcriptional regulator AlpA
MSNATSLSGANSLDRIGSGHEPRSDKSNGSLVVDTPGVAELLGVCPSSVTRLRLAKKMPKEIRLGGLVRFRRAEILAWIDAGCPDQVTWATSQHG